MPARPLPSSALLLVDEVAMTEPVVADLERVMLRLFAATDSSWKSEVVMAVPGGGVTRGSDWLAAGGGGM